MKTIILTFVFGLLSCICFIGCKDKDPTKPGYQNKAPKPIFYRFELGEAKSYLWSKPGSYWIYKNTKTNELDTQTCIGFLFDSAKTKGTEDYSKHINIEYDRLKRNIKSTYNNLVYLDETTKYNADGTPFKGLFFAIMRQADGSKISVMHYPFDYPAKSGTGSSYTSYIGMDSTLSIQGQNYYNVAKFEIDKDDIWEEKLNCIRSNNIYYWAKDVGLIKKESKTCNYSWELIEHQIIK